MIRRITFLLALAAAAASGQPAGPAKELTLLIGRGELLQFANDVVRVAVAEPKVADAVVVSPREVMLNAKGTGYTTIVIWETGAGAQRYEVRVAPDTTESDAFQRKLRTAAPEGIQMTGNAETIVLTGSAKNAEAAREAEGLARTHAKNVINLVKTPEPADPRQIMLQVKFAAVDRAALNEVGFNYFSRNDKTLGSVSSQQFATPRFSQLQFQNQDFANSTLNFSDLLNLFVFRPDMNIGATIRALQAKNLLQILAEPNLIAIEGKEASFLAGGQFPFPTLTATTTGGAVAPVVTVQFKPFGVELDFTPTVMTSGAIHLKVRPSVSALDFSNAVTLQGVLIPALSTRTAATEVILKDGESFAIAGLLDSRVVQVLNRIRGLGDIPIVGHLFRSRSTKKTQDELLVVITPRFVRPSAAGETIKLPAPIEEFLPTTEQELSKKKGKKEKKPEFSGPTGYQEPKAGDKKK